MKTNYSFPYAGFAFEKGIQSSRETIAIHSWAVLNQIKVRYTKEKIEDFLPVGSVRFIETWLDKTFVPNYYPEFAKPILKRKVWFSSNIPVKACFYKPDQYKHFTGCVKKHGSIINCSNVDFWCSEIVEFHNEWRLYITNGEILDTGWYQGADEEKPCPSVGLNLNSVYGALDIGETDQGIQIVEFHHPFAIGWYGTEIEAYIKFLSEGFKTL